MTKKFTATCLFLLMFFVNGYALSSAPQEQGYVLSGRIKDETNKSVDFANIICYKQDTVYLTGCLTDTLGQFKLVLSPGTYKLSVGKTGYQQREQEITVYNNVDIGNIYLKSGLEIDEVVVFGSKQFIKREVDRLVFNVEKIATGNITALDILKNTPGIIVTNDVRMLGKGALKVMINGKDVNLSGQDLISIIQSYNAGSVDQIELITTPPSKYDAEGDVGLLNIVLKKTPNDYLGGNIGYAHSYAKHHFNEINAGVIFSRKQLSATLNIGGGLGKTDYEERNIRHFPDITWKSTSATLNDNKYYSLRGNLDYALPKDWIIGIQFSYSSNRNKRDDDRKDLIYEETQLDYYKKGYFGSSQPGGNYVANFHADKKLDQKGKNMRLDVDYCGTYFKKRATNISHDFSPNNELVPDSEFGYKNLYEYDFRSFSSSLDFDLPFEKISLSTGAKVSFSEADNTLKYYEQTSLDDQDDVFNYQENIYALYLDVARKFNDKWSLKGGLRAEYTHTNAKSILLNSSNKDNYIQLFPTVFLGYRPSKSHSLNMSLSTRVSRPGFRNVNPFRLIVDENTSNQGTPGLKPSLTYKTNIGYTYKGNFNIELYYAYQDEVFTQVSHLDKETNSLTTIWENAMRKHIWGFNNFYIFQGGKWLESVIMHGLSYEKTISYTSTTLPQTDYWLYIIALNNRFILNRMKTLIMTLNLSYTTPQKTAVQYIDSTYDISAGIQYSILKNKLRFGLNLYNIFTSNVKGVTYSNNMKMSFDNKYSYRLLKISVNYNFGAKLSKRYRNSISNDIQRRW